MARLSALDVIHGDDRAIVHHSKLVARGRNVQAADGDRVLDKLDGERVVDEDAENLPVLEPYGKALAPGGATRHL